MSDTISRQAAIDIVRFECGEWRGLAKTIENGLSDLPSAGQYTDDEIQRMQDIEQAQIEKAYDLGYAEGKADAEPQWIPCSEVTGEGYPKEDGFYYVTERNYGFYLDADSKQNVAHTSHFFNGDFTDRFYDENHSNIVAWMSLPDPYKAERKEE